MENMPEYLYHYTSLESLALILKNKTIRLNPLNRMDDMDEEELRNFRFAARYVFASSWTEDINESIPFWSMYTNNMSGVRLKLHSKPFCKYSWKSKNNITVETGFQFYMPMEQITGKDFFITPIDGKVFFSKIEYTNDENKLHPIIGIADGDNVILELGLVGKYKKEAWKFQKEWRYRLLCFPVSIDQMNTKLGSSLCIQRIKNGYELPISHIDLNIDEKYLNDIEIVTGPKMSLGAKILLDKLVEAYCPSARIINSELKIR